MSLVAIPVTFVDNNVLTAAQLNSNFQAIFNEFNGNIADANIKTGAGIAGSKIASASITGTQLANTVITDAKLDYASVKVLRIGPTFPGSGAGLRIARGRKSITFPGAATQTVTVTFSTDSDDGNPNFAVAPRCVGILVRTGGGTASYYCFIGVAATTVNVRFDVVSSNATDATTQSVDWYAIGEA